MDWRRMLAYITGTVDQELLLRNGYLAAENRILRAQVEGRLRLSDPERKTLAEIGRHLGRKALKVEVSEGSDGTPVINELFRPYWEDSLRFSNVARKLGDEVLSISGVQLKCEVLEATIRQKDGRSQVIREWISPSLPIEPVRKEEHVDGKLFNSLLTAGITHGQSIVVGGHLKPAT